MFGKIPSKVYARPNTKQAIVAKQAKKRTAEAILLFWKEARI